jgi:acyl-CoA dehydrogenase
VPPTPNWRLDDAHRAALRAETASWVARALTPHVPTWEAEGGFPRAVFAEAGAQGLFAWKVGPELGGLGPDFLADAVVTEELAACGSGGVSAALGAQKDLGPYYVARFGTDEQRRRWVPAALAGELVGALAITEPEAGSDVAGIATAAARQPDGDWVLNGSKSFITNGSRADVLVVAAVTGPDGDPSEAAGNPHHGQTLFIVEAGDSGLTTRRIPTLGWRTSHTAELAFTDLRLPADRVLGGQDGIGAGFGAVMANFQWERLAMALGATRGAEDALATVAGYGAETRGPDKDGPTTASRELADLSTVVAAARALTEHALRLHAAGEDCVRQVSMAKWHACDAAVAAAEAALAAGQAGGHPSPEALARALRDARLGPIGGGTSEIMKEVIGRTYGL